jgi:FlaA1/EpsC-like NDP-sugar epimerase
MFNKKILNEKSLIFLSDIFIYLSLLAILILLWISYDKSLKDSPDGSFVPNSALIIAIIASISFVLFALPRNILNYYYPKYLITLITSVIILIYALIFYCTEIDKEIYDKWSGTYIAVIVLAALLVVLCWLLRKQI